MALAILEQKSINLDPAPNLNDRGVQAIVSSASLIKKIDDGNLGLGSGQKIVPAKEAEITLNLSNVLLSEAFSEVAQQAGLRYVIKPHALVFLSKTTPEIETVSYRYQITLPIFRKILHGVRTGDYIQPALTQMGATFEQGAEAEFNYRDECIRVTNTEEQITIIEDIFERVANARVITMEEAVRLGLIASSETASPKTSGMIYWLSLVLLAVISVSLATWLTKNRLLGDSAGSED